MGDLKVGYKVLYAETISELTDLVLTEMNNGLLPLGSLVYLPQSRLYVQPVATNDAGGGSSSTITADQIVDATDIGKGVLRAKLTSEANTALGAGTVGSIIFHCEDLLTAQQVLGGTKIGIAVYTAKTADVALTALGASEIGSKVFAAATTADAISAIGALAAGGTAASATKLATARAIKATGGATGSVSFDGSADVELKVTLADPTTTTPGGIVQIPNIADPTDSTDTPTAVKNLFAALRDKKIMASS